MAKADVEPAVENKNTNIRQGATWKRVYYYRDSDNVPIDISNYQIHGEIRQTKTSSSRLLATMTIEIVDGPGGAFSAELTPQETAAIDRSGYYDIELADGNGNVIRLVQGRAKLDTEVTAS